MPESVADQLREARDRLLDLTLSNRLLNYRPPLRASIRVVDERLEQVWRLLVEEERELQFLPDVRAEARSRGGTGADPGDELSSDTYDGGAGFSLPGLEDEPASGR